MKNISVICSLCILLIVSQQPVAEASGFPHSVGVVKLIVDDLAETQHFYEKYFDLREVSRFHYDPDTFEETIMAFAYGEGYNGAQLALFAPNPKAEAPLPKSRYPVVLIYTADYDRITEAMDGDGLAVDHLSMGEGGPRIASARDPSGNVVEIFAREGVTEIGGSKLIVNDRLKAEAFYQRIFNAKSGEVFAADNVYDEVIMEFEPGGTWLALFQPLTEAPLSKSRFPVTVFYTSEFDAVVGRIKEEGLTMREVVVPDSDMQIVITKDPAGNAIEIIAR